MPRGDPEEPSSASDGDKENERPAQRYAPTSAHTQLTYLSDPLEDRSRTLAETSQIAEETYFLRESKPL